MLPSVISVIQFYFIQRWVKLKLGWSEEERSREHSVKLTEEIPECPGFVPEESGNHTGSSAGLMSLECVITDKVQTRSEVSAKRNCMYNPDQEMWPNSD